MKVIDIIESSHTIKEMLKDCPYDILNKWEIKTYKKGKIVCHQDMAYDHFFIIVEGFVNIYLEAENGKKYSQSIYRKGDYFGELEIFDNKPYICSIEALTEVTVIRLHRKHFIQWINKDRHFSLYITKTLCDSFYKLSKKAGEDTLYSLKYRLCNYLLYRLDEGKKLPQGIEIKIDKEYLSEQFVVTQRSINRILQQMKEKGILEVENNAICILDIQGLREEERISRKE
jgi:CRP-like cAMP-binding protein